ncbi:hypothetical protein VP01_2465g1 [Puccinia sorghi]|uniref:Uncharacterized protein n=1 Tax=Puccinia sorghi TaxID=27349 RepID=A0A0L6V6P9_9BASI|nr:hypothetical protein VP01_2465g1 [Puccinia sorghi]
MTPTPLPSLLNNLHLYPTPPPPPHLLQANLNPLNHQSSPLQSSLPVHTPHSHPLSLKPNLAQNPPRKLSHPTYSFEPSGKSLRKYAHPKPHLDVTLNSQPPNQPYLNEPWRHNINNNSTHSIVLFPRKPLELSVDPSMEVLKDRYWNTRQSEINPDTQQIWAEIYISRLERQLWKAQADADPSPDCLSFCIPLTSNDLPHKLYHYNRRRTASASDAALPRPGATSSHLQGCNQSKTSKRPRFNSTDFLKPFSIAQTRLKLLPWYSSSALDISDGPLHRRPSSNITRSQSSCVITPYRLDSFSDSSFQLPASSLPLATNSAVGGANPTTDFPRHNCNQDRRARIIRPPATTNQQQSKSFRRRSRSVPNLRRANLYSSAVLESTTGITGYPSWVPDELTSQANFSIPQSLIDALFPPASASSANPPCHPSNSNLLSIDSISQAVRRVSTPKNQHRSICATIEVADSSDPSAPSNPPAVPSAPLEPITKGPLHSLPRVIEHRPAAIVPLPPPPRKRNLTPTTSIYSSSQNSLNVAGKRITSETNRSTSETKRSTGETKWSITDSMIANLSFPTPSDKSAARNRTRAISFRLSRAYCSPPIPPEPLLDLGADATFPDPQIHPAGPTFECPQRRRRQSSFSAYPASPTCDSAFDSTHEHSGILSQSSGQQCSLGVVDSFVERQNRTSTSIPESPLLSALYLDPRIEHPLNYTGRYTHNLFHNTIDSSRRSSHSSLCESSHSVIDPDKPINQADLFYQIPASPRRSLIQDYDDLVVKSRKASYDKAETGPLTTAAKRSGLIDDILAEYAGPREAQMMGSDHLQLENELGVTETVVDFTEDRSDSRSAVTHTVPNIVDAFEARGCAHAWDKSYNQKY